MLAPEIVSLTQMLHDSGQHITIETAGTVIAPVAADLMSISPKLANSTPFDREDGRWATQHDRLRYQPDVLSNALKPGWVPTKMGGPGAPDDLSLAPVTQAWLAVSDDPEATVTAGYFYHQRPRQVHPAARDPAFQDELLNYCASLTGVTLPVHALPAEE